MKLTRSDPATHGEHRYISIADIAGVGVVVRLRPPAFGNSNMQG